MSEEPAEGAAPGIRFALCAMIDLLGFSSHLETSGYDLRTTIGAQAIERLETLERALRLIEIEAAAAPEANPEGVRIIRINDSLILTLDLDDFLLPGPGQTSFSGHSANDLKNEFDLDAGHDAVTAAYRDRMLRATDPIRRFLGLVARAHLYIRSSEAKNLHPGARTVVATGFRRPFTPRDGVEDDQLSANFAFANVAVADRVLHGPHFFVDNNLLELLARDRLAHNLLRFACFSWEEYTFEPLSPWKDHDGASQWGPVRRISQPVSVDLFRREYQFRRLNPSPLCFLQHLNFIAPFLSGRSAPHENHFFRNVVGAIECGPTEEMVANGSPAKTFLYGGQNHLDASIIEFREMLEEGTSETRKMRQRLERLEADGHAELIDNPKFNEALDQLESETVTIPVDPIPPGMFGDALWTFPEWHISAFQPFFAGDGAFFDYPPLDSSETET